MTVTGFKKGFCPLPGCGEPGRLYPCGVRDDRHAPGVLRAAAAAAVEVVDAPARKRAAKYSETRQVHTWTRLEEHHRQCGFCGIHVVNETSGRARCPNGGLWWQTWTWPDGSTGTNRGDPTSRVPRCPGPATEERAA